jgi:hypothetical protein
MKSAVIRPAPGPDQSLQRNKHIMFVLSDAAKNLACGPDGNALLSG